MLIHYYNWDSARSFYINTKDITHMYSTIPSLKKICETRYWKCCFKEKLNLRDKIIVHRLQIREISESFEVWKRYYGLMIRFKVWLSLSQKIFFFFNESHLKIINNISHFVLKDLFVIKILKFLFWLFGHVKKRLRKTRLISKPC